MHDNICVIMDKVVKYFYILPASPQLGVIIISNVAWSNVINGLLLYQKMKLDEVVVPFLPNKDSSETIQES